MKTIYLLLILFTSFGHLLSDEPKIQSEQWQTKTGEFYNIVKCDVKFAPVYYVFSYQGEGEKLFELFCKTFSGKSHVVLLTAHSAQSSIGGYIKYFEQVDADVRSKLEVHPQRVYCAGFRNGATIAMAVSKWMKPKVKGIILVNGYHWPIAGHPILQSVVYSFGHSGGRELSSLKQLKDKYASYSVDFVVEEFDKKSDLPSVEAFLNAYNYLEENWIITQDGITDLDRSFRLDRFNETLNKIGSSDLQDDKKYLKLVNLFKTYSNSTYPKLKILLDKLNLQIESIKNNSDLIRSYESYLEQIKVFETQVKNYENVYSFCEVSKEYTLKFPNSIISEVSEVSEKKWRDYIADRRLDIRKPDSKFVIDNFMLSIQNAHTEESKVYENVKKVYESCLANNTLEDFIPNSLMVSNKRFQIAMFDFSTNELKAAYQALGELKSDSVYINAYRFFYMAKINLILEKYELAEVQFNEFLLKHSQYTTHQADAFFNLAISKYKTLQYAEAKKLLDEFMIRYPEAGERLRVAAYQLVEKIDSFEEGSLQDVEEKMSYSQRKIRHGDLKEGTRKEQKEIVKLLDKLIEQEEKKEQEDRDRRKEQQEQKSPKGDGEPAESSELDEGETKIGSLKKFNKGSPKDSWGKMREKEREKVFNEMKKELPQEYKGLIEQYFKKLQEAK